MELYAPADLVAEEGLERGGSGPDDVTELPNYTLALRLAHEAGLREIERRKADENLASHVAVLGAIARRAAPHLDERTSGELASTMISVALGPSASGLETDPAALRRQLRALLRGYGIVVARETPARASG